jgi:2-oxoglutarate decarboxylase
MQGADDCDECTDSGELSMHDEESGRSGLSSQTTGVENDEGSSEFGANEWLVEELYEQFKVDKRSVDESWWPILESYHSTVVSKGGSASAVTAEQISPAATESEQVAEASGASTPPTSPVATVSTEAPSGASVADQRESQPEARTTSVQARQAPIPAEAPVSSPKREAAAESTSTEDDVEEDTVPRSGAWRRRWPPTWMPA